MGANGELSVRGGGSSGLLERGAELAAIEAAVDGVGAGAGGRVLLITGPPGIGKTTLLEATCDRAQGSGFDVKRARGGPLERDLPHAIVRSLLERPGDDADYVYKGFAGLARPLFEPLGPGGKRNPLPDRDELSHAIYWMLVNLSAARPIALLVDDAHDGDDASLAVLAYLAARIAALDVLLVVASRLVFPPSPQLAVIGEIAGPEARLEPAELTRDGVRHALAARLGTQPPPALLHACFAASEGNPELVHVLAGEAAAEGADAGDLEMLAPSTVMRVVLDRLNLLGPEERAIAEAVAILEAQATVPRIAALAAMPPARVGDGLARLESSRLMSRGLPPAFAHPTIAESVSDQISPARRSLLHQHAAELLRADGLPADVQALHLLHTEPAGEQERVEILLEAGISSRKAAAPEAAIRCFERALREPAAATLRPRTLTELGRAEIRIGDEDGISTLRAALEETPDPVGRALVARHLARALIRFERWDEAADVLVAARAALGEADPQLALDIETAALVAAWTRGEAAGRDERLARVAEGIGESSVATRARALSTMTWAAAIEGRSAELVRELAAERVGLGNSHEDGNPAEAMAMMMAVSALAGVDEHERAYTGVESLLADAEEHGSFALPLLASQRMMLLWRQGRYAEALEGEALLAALGPTHPAIAPLAAVLVESDRLDDAEAFTLPSDRVDDSVAMTLGWELVQFARGRLLSERGRFAEAADAFEHAGQIHLHHGIHGPSLIAWRSQAGLAHLRAGDRARGARLIGEEVEVTEAYGALGSIGIATAADGVLRGGEEGAKLLAEADRILGETGLLGEQAAAIYERGALTRRSGRDREAREHLRRALDLADGIGAHAVARHCREELAAAGARPRRAALSGPGSLTPSERRVAEAAARGQTNQEIAAELFLSVKTVEMHLSNSYRKLELRSRKELPAALATDGRP